jgi:hypothetical protein
MPLVAPAIEKEMEAAILSALTAAFATEATADPSSHRKIAGAVAKGVTTVLVKAIQTQAEVLPGIATAGTPAAQTSVSPGKIF